MVKKIRGVKKGKSFSNKRQESHYYSLAASTNTTDIRQVLSSLNQSFICFSGRQNDPCQLIKAEIYRKCIFFSSRDLVKAVEIFQYRVYSIT